MLNNSWNSFFKSILIILSAASLLACGVTDKNKNKSTSTYEIVKKRGVLRCGIHQSLPGFSFINEQGKRQGIDVDICRAVAAAVLSDADKVKYIVTTTKDRFLALQTGDIDILVRNTSWTLTRDTSLKFAFTAVNFYDGQGFMVHKSSGIKSARQLRGATICMSLATTTELNVADYFKAKGMNYTPLSFTRNDEVVSAYREKRCDVYTADISALIIRKASFADKDQHLILPEVISKEPLSALVRQTDMQWKDIVTWSIFAMINAEEIGITSKNVDAAKHTLRHHPIAMRLLGVEGNVGTTLDLDKEWAYRIIKQVGNYGESYDRNLGKNSVISLPRGINNLWLKGGLMYAPPVL